MAVVWIESRQAAPEGGSVPVRPASSGGPSHGAGDNRADLSLRSAKGGFTRVRSETDLLGVY